MTGPATTVRTEADAEVAGRVEHVLDSQIRRLLHSHGGDVSVVGVDDGHVVLDFHGRCQVCPSFGVTLHAVIEPELMQADGVRSIELAGGVMSPIAARKAREFFGIEQPIQLTGTRP